MKTFIGRTIISILLVLLAAAPAKPVEQVRPGEGKVIKFGFIRPITGFVANLGRMQDVAADLVIGDLNGQGGINGVPLALVKYDSPFDPKQAGLLVRRLANEDKVFVIFGPFSTGEIEVAFPIANELGIPIVWVTGGIGGLPAKNRPWAFRLGLCDEDTLPPLLKKFMETRPGSKTAVIAGDVKQSNSDRAIRQIYPDLLRTNGIQVIDTITCVTDDVDVSAQVTKLKMLKPDFVAFSGMFGVAALWAKEMKRQGVTTPVITTNASFQGAFITLAGANAGEGWMSVSNFWRDNPDPRVKSYVARFSEKARQANLPAPEDTTHLEAALYDAITITAKIARTAGLIPDTPLDKARLELRKGWESLKDYDDALVCNGVIKLTTQPTGEVPNSAVIWRVENGRWTVLK